MKPEYDYFKMVYAWQDSWNCLDKIDNHRVIFFSGERELFTLYNYNNIKELIKLRKWLESIIKNEKENFVFVFNQNDKNNQVILQHAWEGDSEKEEDFSEKCSFFAIKTPNAEYCFLEPTAYLLGSIYLPLLECAATQCRAANDELDKWNLSPLQYYNLCKSFLLEEKLYGISCPAEKRPWIWDVLVLNPDSGDFLWDYEGECGHIDYGIRLRNGKQIDISPIRDRLKKWMFYRYENPDAFDETNETYNEQCLQHFKEGLSLARILREMLPANVDLYYDGDTMDFLPEKDKKALCHLQSSGTRDGFSWEFWYHYAYIPLEEKRKDIFIQAIDGNDKQNNGNN